jgi:hypothetical protein
MATHEQLNLHIIEVRHPGGTFQRKVYSPSDTVLHVFTDAGGNSVLMDCQAKDVPNWALAHEGFEAAFGTVELPPISLHMVIDKPGFMTNLNLGAVCETDDLWREVEASGGIGIVFKASDVQTILEQDTEEFEDLSLEEKADFLDEHLRTFTIKLEETLTEKGDSYISNKVSSEFETAFKEFKQSRASAPRILKLRLQDAG